MKPVAKVKNVGRGEAIFRSVIGFILIILRREYSLRKSF